MCTSRLELQSVRSFQRLCTLSRGTHVHEDWPSVPATAVILHHGANWSLIGSQWIIDQRFHWGLTASVDVKTVDVDFSSLLFSRVSDLTLEPAKRSGILICHRWSRFPNLIISMVTFQNWKRHDIWEYSSIRFYVRLNLCECKIVRQLAKRVG